MNLSVTIINYGIGNIFSVKNAFEYLGCNVIVTDNADVIKNSENIVLPGVGSFKNAMKLIKEKEIDKAIHEASCKKSKILGICLGMQLLGKSSTEGGVTDGLGVLDFEVKSFKKIHNFNTSKMKIPHVGFNSVSFLEEKGFFLGLKNRADFYFTHSYMIESNALNEKYNKGICNYGIDFTAAFHIENIFATQFHPEKSLSNGLVLLKNFLEV